MTILVLKNVQNPSGALTCACTLCIHLHFLFPRKILVWNPAHEHCTYTVDIQLVKFSACLCS